MDHKELDEILRKHKEWIEGKPDGKRANLRNADLRGANLCGANLRGAYMYGAELYGADLRGADLCGAYMYGADLRGANLCGANLRGAYMYGAELYGADLRGADLCGADLRNADLRGAVSNHNTSFLAMACPEEGAFIGFKKAGGRIVKLLIPEDAKRSSATTRKCRCSKAKVLSITELDGSEYEGNCVASNYDGRFIYRVGEMVEVPDYNENRWNECSTGIHFFITRDEAVRW